MRESIMTGKTVDEAMRKAKEELGVTTEDTGFEILQMPRRGFLGFKNTPAKVRVYIEEPEEEVKVSEPLKREPSPAPRRQPAPARPLRPVEEKSAQRTAQPLSPAPPPPAATAPKEAVKPEPRKTPKPQTDRAPRPERPSGKKEPFVPTPEEALSEKAKAAVKYIRAILESMGVTKAVVSARQTSESIEILLEGEGLGVIIGRRGETLDAVQYLTSLVANRVDGEYMRISIDSGDYRKKRAETLEKLAQKLARNAVKTGRSTKLEPMNPYERRIIHAAVSRVEGATSSSIGEEPNRRVVISSKNPRKRPESTENREGGDIRESREPHEGRDKRAPRENCSGRGGFRDGQRPQRVSTVPRTVGDAKAPVKISDSEIEIPKELAPRELPPVQPAPPKAETAPKTPSAEEKEALPLYGKLEI